MRGLGSDLVGEILAMSVIDAGFPELVERGG